MCGRVKSIGFVKYIRLDFLLIEIEMMWEFIAMVLLRLIKLVFSLMVVFFVLRN